MARKTEPKDVLRLCSNLLEVIEEVRAKSTCCNTVSGTAIKILKICTNVLFPKDTINNRKNIQYFENIEEIEACLISCLDICKNVANETENYFGIFEVQLFVNILHFILT